MSERAVEAEIEAAVRGLLDDWLDPSPAGTERFLAGVATDFTGHGTGPGDYYADRDALRRMVLREHAAMPYPFTLEVPWLTVHLLRPGVAYAEGALRVTIDAGDETIVEAPRFTFVLERRDGPDDGRWLLVHFHFSVPDEMQDEGDTMADLLASRNRQLEEEVARRTADLERAQARLVQQEKMASLGQLTAGIAHEIKNPLNFVTGFAGLSQELIGDLDAETDPDERAALLGDIRENAAKIEAHARRADAIVRQMMAHARSGGGDRRRVSANDTVREYADLAWHGLRARQPGTPVTVERDLAEDAGEVVAAPEEVGRALINLLDNAFDAVAARAAEAPPGYVPTVTVSTRRRGARVEVRVADNGTGMPEAVRQRVFDPFYTTKPTGRGTGLGLSLSHDIIVQGHGGTLEVESAEGEGSAFVLTLPAA